MEISRLLGLDKYENISNPSITYQNLKFWHIYIQYLTYKYFATVKDLEKGNAKVEGDLFNSINHLLTIFNSTIEYTELKKHYPEVFFLQSYFQWNKNKDIVNTGLVESNFKLIKEVNKLPTYFMLVMEVLSYVKSLDALLRMDEYLEKNIKSKKDIQLDLLLIRNQILKKDSQKANELVLALLTNHSINEYVLSNLIIIFEDFERDSIALSEEIFDKINNLKVDNHYSSLLFFM
ncbi:MAG: hypothetical protein IPK62_02075 [Bacteroidetes bacterium]|nr:hypothetical protein [Bacteroidota bacterium]